MGSREKRFFPRRGSHARFDEKFHHGRENTLPSRHLWVGNLSESLTERALAHHFLQFGKLESVAFQPGRSYAFVNYRNDEDAFAAVKALQGYNVEGNPLRIEFAKAEKSPNTSRDAQHSYHRDEPIPFSRNSLYPPRDSRDRYSSPDPPFPHKSKINGRDSEPRINDQDSEPRINGRDSKPSEVLWVGFPTHLKVDEFILRKAFSPFGEIEKITTFPGRSYAFVRYINVVAARRAKETLQGKLFGNPRVDIHFAKNESGPSIRISRNSPYERPESPRHFQSDRNTSNMVRNDFRNDSHDPRRFNIYENLNSPSRHLSPHFREISPPRRTPYHEASWDLPEDNSFMKRPKIDPYPDEDELPEYPLEKVKRVIPQEILNKNFDSVSSGYRPGSDRSPQDFQLGFDLRKSPPQEVWKWEGMIVKGGNPICRARCFPVGKPLDMALPKYLECTSRTSLDMLEKHYYQSHTAWIVFFVPANDHDIPFYNDFMNFLSERQRAAVATLDDRTTMFLAPPSEFSEKVLKVPGKLSISGVVLRLNPQPESSSNHSVPQNDAYNKKPNYEKPGNTQNWAPHDLNMPRQMHEATQNKFTPEVSGIPLQQLQGHFGNLPPPPNYIPAGNINQFEHRFQTSQSYGLQNEQVGYSEFSQPQYGQVHQVQQVAQTETLRNSGQENGVEDPQQRLQATLKLAASLLQQIKQAKGT